MFKNMLEKALKIGKSLTMGYSRLKKVNKNVKCPINVISSKFDQFHRRPDILGQTLDLKVSNLFLTPPMLQTSDLDRNDQNCHFIPTIAL